MSACSSGSWTDWAAWARGLLIALSTVLLNTWLAFTISRRERRRPRFDPPRCR